MSSWFGLPSPVALQKENSSESSSGGSHPGHIVRADTGAAFSALKCPHDSGLEKTCELPFGFVWTPMAARKNHKSDMIVNKIPVIKCDSDSLPPVLCLACLAYINPFAELDENSGIWTCPLCGHENVVPEKEIREGSKIMTALTSTCVEYRQAVSKPDPYDEEKKDDGRYGKCDKYNKEKEDYCTYVLVVDENLSPKDGQAIAPALKAIFKDQRSSCNPEDAYSKIRIGLIVFGKAVSIYQLGLSGLTSADIYVAGDLNEDDDEVDKGMEKRAYIEVQLGDFTSLGNALSSIFGIAVDDRDDKFASHSKGLFSSRMAMLSRKKAARLRKEESSNDDNMNVTAKSPWVKHRKESFSGNPKRCTGKAIQCALNLAGASTSKYSRTSRIILFTNGCPNSGDGSVVNPNDRWEKAINKEKKRATHSITDTSMLQQAIEYFDMTANIAVSIGIGVDVICCGVTELALPVYQAMVEPSGGYVLPLVTLDSPQLKRNLKFILNSTYMSRSMCVPEDMHGMNGAECILDIRSDSFVTPTQMCGSGQVLVDLNCEMVENERSAFEEGSKLALEKGFKVIDLPSEKALELSMTRIQVGRVDPLSTVTVLLEVDDSIGEEDDYAFFQLVSRYISRRGDAEITRVCSLKLPIAEDVNDFLGSVDDEAMSVVLAKVAVYRSLYGREETDDTRDLLAARDTNMQEKLALDAQLDLDATIQRISGTFRLLDLQRNSQRRSDSRELRSDKKNSQSSFDFAFPPQLKETLNRLYHLRRGHLISPGPMRSMDDRAESRGLFIRFPVEDCLQMMRPSIWSTGSTNISSAWDAMLPFPAETLALWDDSIIAADFHDALFIWSGANCTTERYNGIRETFRTHLLKISNNRFPMPELHELKDGDSMSRRFTSRLAPSHADPIDNQIVHFPLLSTLKPAALKNLRSKFKFYDAKSDESFRTWFWSVASASNISRFEGMSLCE